MGFIVGEDVKLDNRSPPSPSPFISTLSLRPSSSSHEVTVSNGALQLMEAEEMRNVLTREPELHFFLSPLDPKICNILYSTFKVARHRNLFNPMAYHKFCQMLA